jgi:hypothetical protein
MFYNIFLLLNLLTSDPYEYYHLQFSVLPLALQGGFPPPHGLSPQANYTDRLSDRSLSAKLVPTLTDRGCRVVSPAIPPQSFILVLYNRATNYLKNLLKYIHVAEWTPLQTHYFSEKIG